MTLMNTLRGIGVVLLAGASIASAQQYPSKPVHIIVPAAPGGAIDLTARTLGQKISEALGQPVVIDNRGGAAGNIGTALGAKAAPDGYTLVITYTGPLAIAPWLYKKLDFHPLRDFAHITQTSSYPLLGVVHPSLPVKSLKELAAFARTHPKELTVGSAAATTRLTAELFQIITGTKMTHVPYKGAGPVSIDLVGGHIALAFPSAASVVGYVKNGRLRALVTTGASRLATLPDVPTSKEAGYPGLEIENWYGVSAPANTPKQIVARLNAEFVRALKLPDVRDRLVSAGLEPVSGSSEEFTAYIKADYERWGQVVKKVGLTPQ